MCTPGNIFYIPGSLGRTKCPSCTLSDRINAVAAAGSQFVTVYGGLKWTASNLDPQTEFWNLWGDTINKLSDDIVPVGAQEMARLAREAHQ